MSFTSHRSDRLAYQIRELVAKIIASELRDPRIGFATVTRAEVSGDAQFVRVHVSVLGNAETQQRTLEGLASAAGFVRHELSHRLRLRRAPELAFALDHGPEEALKLEALIQNLHTERTGKE